MAKTLANIQVLVRFYARDDSVDLTTTTNLAVVNEVYRELANIYSGQGFYVSGTLTATTVADQELYNWSGASFPKFMDLKTIEIQSLSNDPDAVDDDIFNTSTITAATARTTWKEVQVPPDEFEWNLAGRRASVVTPLFYRRIDTGGVDQIAFRPAPSESAYAIKATGIGEPTELSASSDVTAFVIDSADDAFVHMISERLATRDGMTDIANDNKEKLASIMKGLLVKEQITAEVPQ